MVERPRRVQRRGRFVDSQGQRLLPRLDHLVQLLDEDGACRERFVRHNGQPDREPSLKLADEGVGVLCRLIPAGETRERYAALLELVPIAETLELPIREQTRRPLRLKVPQKLKDVIDRRVKETGQSFVAVLLAVVAKYREQHASEHLESPKSLPDQQIIVRSRSIC